MFSERLARIEVGGEVVEVGGDEMEVVEEARGGWVVRSEGRYTVALDPTLDEALRREGLARELVNRIQRLRRDSGLEITDRIRLAVGGSEAVCAAAREHEAAIARETLAAVVEVGARADEELAARKEVVVDGEAAVLGLARQA